VTACVVDAQYQMFQCSENGEREFSIPFEKGYLLECASPEDTEYFLKACKRGEIVEVTECRYKDPSFFYCTDVTGEGFDLPVMLADKYFCMTPQHKKRVIDRCLKL
jgi:hypothetical protein